MRFLLKQMKITQSRVIMLSMIKNGIIRFKKNTKLKDNNNNTVITNDAEYDENSNF